MRILILCGLMVLPAAAQDDSWKKEIDNSLVQVARRVVEPHETVFADGIPPSLLVFVTDCSVRLTTAARQEALRGKPGEFFWHSGGRIGLENLADHRVEAAQVVPKFAPELSFQLPAANAQRVKFENDLIRIRHIGPRSAATSKRAAGRLENPAPSVLIELSAIHSRLTHTSGRVEEIRVKAGDIWFQAGDAPFYLETLGDWSEHEALRIELKTRAAKP